MRSDKDRVSWRQVVQMTTMVLLGVLMFAFGKQWFPEYFVLVTLAAIVLPLALYATALKYRWWPQ